MEHLQAIIDDYVTEKSDCRLLEAGCGSMSMVRLDKEVHVTGIDISELQLARNRELSERIQGDIQTYQFAPRSYDIIICWHVLEHLSAPQLAVDNFLRAVKPGGLIILAYPNLYSLKGVVTKLTPHIVHIWYYRYLLHQPEAGKNDTAPFVTPFRMAATYPEIRRRAASHGASEVLFVLRESDSMRYVRRNFWYLDLIIKASSSISRASTFGRLDVAHSDCVQVLKSSCLQ